jgi:ATP-dependent protease HslVU (ClpYQ) peptidase subunit
MLIITSTGSISDAEVQVEARVIYTGSGNEYAQEHYDALSTGRAATEELGVAQNKRW